MTFSLTGGAYFQSECSYSLGKEPSHIQHDGEYIFRSYPFGNYMFQVTNRNTRTRCEICSKVTIKTPDVVLVSYLLTLNIFHSLF